MPWQVAFLAAVCGLLALRWPLPALACLAVLVLLARRLGAAGPRVWALGAAFLLGLGWGWLRLPAEPAPLPAWAAGGAPVRLHGVVADFTDRPGGRAQVLLADLRIEPRGKGGAGESGETAPDSGPDSGPGSNHDAAPDSSPNPPSNSGPARPSLRLPGRALWSWYDPTARPAPGSAVTLDARVYRITGYGNPGAWDYAFSWRTRGALWRTYSPGPRGLTLAEVPGPLSWRLREGLEARVAALLPLDQGGAMVRALLFGDRSGLDPEVSESLTAAGLAHTLALSGLHLGFVVLLGVGLARLAGRVRPGLYLRVARPRLAVLLAAPLVAGYCWLGGFSPSLVRAACMFAAWGWLLWRGRDRVLLDGLFFALAVILLVSPLSVFDLRLQLSALAVAGIVVLLPLARPLGRILDALPEGLEGWRAAAVRWGLVPVRDLGAVLAMSLAAQLAVLPVTAWTFGRLAPNFLLNAVWLPVLGLAVLPLGLAGLVLAPCWPDAAAPLLGAAAGIQDRLLDLLAWGRAAGL
ncbi:MAG: ComEC/Rec2 family competence protein, partial [Desulfovibrionaceae bacterium]